MARLRGLQEPSCGLCAAPAGSCQPRALTHHPGVVVVRQHALAEGHQQPEGLLLAAIEQEHRGDDVHGLWAQRELGRIQSSPFPTSKPENNKLSHLTLGHLPKGSLQEINVTKWSTKFLTGPAGMWTPVKVRVFSAEVFVSTGPGGHVNELRATATKLQGGRDCSSDHTQPELLARLVKRSFSGGILS